MKLTRPVVPPLIRIGLPLAVLLVLAACTPGGQFDPTTLIANDMFDTKKKLQGQREPVFPNGVPGTNSGVPPDLVKGYQPPPENTAADTNAGQDGADADPDHGEPRGIRRAGVSGPVRRRDPAIAVAGIAAATGRAAFAITLAQSSRTKTAVSEEAGRGPGWSRPA